MTFARIVLFVSVLVLACCGPGTQRDRDNFERFEAMKPTAFANAPVIETWRGFGSWRENDTSRQCAVIVYEVTDAGIAQFTRELTPVLADLQAYEGSQFWGWRISGSAPPQFDARVRSSEPWAQDDPLLQLRRTSNFCNMPAAQHERLLSAFEAIWTRGGAPVFARYASYDGGVLGGTRKHLYFFAALDAENRRLYTWFSAYPSSGG